MFVPINQIQPAQAAAIARVIDGWSHFGQPGITFEAYQGFGVSIAVKLNGETCARVDISATGQMRSTVYTLWQRTRRDRDAAINAELASMGMKLADDDGWLIPTSFGVVYATYINQESE